MVRKFVTLRVRISVTEGWYPNIDSLLSENSISMSPTYPVRLSPKFNLKLQ